MIKIDKCKMSSDSNLSFINGLVAGAGIVLALMSYVLLQFIGTMENLLPSISTTELRVAIFLGVLVSAIAIGYEFYNKGKGAGERPSISGAKGTARYVAEYARMDTIITIVDDALVEKVVSAIMKEASTGKRGDGKIFVSTVETTYDISTQKKEQ